MDQLDNINKTELAKFLGLSRQSIYIKLKNNTISKEQIEEFKKYKETISNSNESERLKEEIEILKQSTKAKINHLILENESQKETIRDLRNQLAREQNKKTPTHTNEEYENLLHRYQNKEALVLYYQRILIEEGLYDIKRSKHKTKTTRK